MASIFSWTILGILSITALLGNGFIIAVNGQQWLQKGKMAPCDFLLTSLSAFRFLQEWISILGYPTYFSFSQSNTYSYILKIMKTAWFFFNIGNLWCATWLSIFYCMKVANFPGRLFFWLKIRISVLAPRLLGMSITVTMVFSFPSIISYFGNQKSCNLTEIQPVNNCQEQFIVPLPLQFTFIAINFSLNVMASILLLNSLWRHIWNLRRRGTAFKDLSTQVHINVMKFLLFYLFLYILYFTGMILATGHILEFGRPERIITGILMSAFSSAHSVILIFTNPKLKEASARIRQIRERPS